MKVLVEIDDTELLNDHGRPVEGLLLRCTRCNHEVQVFGVDPISARAGAVLLRDECPQGESNFYDVSDYEG